MSHRTLTEGETMEERFTELCGVTMILWMTSLFMLCGVDMFSILIRFVLMRTSDQGTRFETDFSICIGRPYWIPL